MQKKQIIVCGYPKSGNTWVTRLTAEIVGCPSMGFWCEPFNRDPVREGEDRESNYSCFKAHHSSQDLIKTFPAYANGNPKIIYIYRDPRDVIVSAANFFSLPQQFPRLIRKASRLPGFKPFYKRIFQSFRRKADKLTVSMIEGGTVGNWMQIPWNQHVRAYLELDDCLRISYESLLKNQLAGAHRIAEFIGIDRDDADLTAAIKSQSFERRKREFVANGDSFQQRFLRTGKTGEWKNALSSRNIHKIESAFGPLLSELGYPLSKLPASDK